MKKGLWIAVVLVVFGGVFVYMTTGSQLKFGTPDQTAMDDYFIAHGQEQTGANNIVTAVVFDYRAFDTLGEATVLFVVVLGVGLMFRRLKEDEEEDSA
ncbi:hypothetical protein K8S19_10125 [bacterium]|nr:hypothetical protein [bacterium]